MITVGGVFKFIDEFAPFESAEDFDNVGLLVGDIKKNISNILVCLDITKDVLYKAKEKSTELIVSHHPVIFNPLKKVLKGSLIYEIIKFELSVISAHTNLDKAVFGVASCLADAVGLKDVEILKNTESCARIGNLENSMECTDFIKYVSFKLKTPVRAVENKKQIKRVAVGPGSSLFALKSAIKEKADAFITGESKHEVLIEAKNENFCFVDASHFATEAVVLEPLAKKMEAAFKNYGVKVFVFDDRGPARYFFGEKIWG